MVCWVCLAGIGSEVRAGILPRVAVLSPDPANSRDAAFLFLKALPDLGYVDGRNIRLQSRFAEKRLDWLPALAAELVE